MFISQCKKNEVGKMRVRRRDTRIWFLSLGIFAAVFLFTFLSHSFKKMDEKAEAASLANFDPGFIISDYQMGNYNSMTEAEIQAFLTMKNPCDNTDYNYYLRLSANPNYTWHFANGHFVCLSEEKFGDGEVIGSGDTAAHILWQAAQDYKINPQSLIVLLQKETGLITDRIPNNGDYRKATGYGCPDTAPCSAQYYGFKNQVRRAAALFRTVLDGGWTNYPLGENYVQYNPNPACGGSVVNIRSLATSALYRYTPYQPNAGALAAGYGTASCGAYGNRNFYLYFEDWFGGITDDKDMSSNGQIRRLINQYASVLGQKVTELMTEDDGRVWQTFENGTIIYSEETGAHMVLNGPVATKWAETGGSLGKLGKPKSDTSNESDGRIWQTFENGTIIYTEATGANVVYSGPIATEWAKSGGSYGKLGKPTSDTVTTETWLYQKFEKGGIIYKNETEKVFSIENKELFSVWFDGLSNDDSELGVPISPLHVEHDGRIWQTYENGTIIYHVNTGGNAVMNGIIATEWAKSGGSYGKLGKPTSNKIESSDFVYQKFEKGGILYKKATPENAFVVDDKIIFDKWLENASSEGTKIGVPISAAFNEYDGRHWQTYENGTIIYHVNTGSHIVMNGSIATKWAQSGGSYGTLGKPKTDLYDDEKWSYQGFEKGGIFSSKTQEKTIAINDVALFEGWVKNVFEEKIDLGMPVSMTFSEYDGRHWQTYEKGTMIYHADNGAFVVQNGPMSKKWAEYGGSLGQYGRPVSNQKITNGVLSQDFLNGTIEIQSETE